MVENKLTFRKRRKTYRSPFPVWFLLINDMTFDAQTHVQYYKLFPTITYYVMYKGKTLRDINKKISRYDTLYKAKQALVKIFNEEI
jgi:hypothetical protein